MNIEIVKLMQEINCIGGIKRIGKQSKVSIDVRPTNNWFHTNY